MARMKHFPTITEYAAWVAKHSANTVLGTAFDGLSYPYEAYLSEYYGTNVVVFAGECYEMNNRRYNLPFEWDGFTVGYHESDLRDAYEAADGPQSGIEITSEMEEAYLTEWGYLSPAPCKPALVIVAREETSCEVVYFIQSGEHTYIAQLQDGAACNCKRTTGESCAAWYYRRSCKHTALASRNESDMQQHVQDEKFSCPSCGQPRKRDTLCYRCAA